MENMEKSAFSSNSDSEFPHKCGPLCLCPLSFHRRAVGAAVQLSAGCRRAEKTKNTFKDGLVFSSRPLRVQERIRLKVERTSSQWHGALRVGFTTESPSKKALPLPVIAIPDLTDRPGHWAAPVDEFSCQAGSQLEFWVSHGGNLYIRSNNGRQKMLSGVDLSRPLWAMIDIYGATASIFLLGSKKKWLLGTRRSYSAPECITWPDSLTSTGSKICGSTNEGPSSLDKEIPADGGNFISCVVCLDQEARVTLPCGHRCLCHSCSSKVLQMFGNCPLCRTECY